MRAWFAWKPAPDGSALGSRKPVRRSIRYGSIMIASTITRATAPPISARSRIRAPAATSIAADEKHATIAVPRSGSTTTSRQISATAMRNGVMSPIDRVSLGRVASRCAP